jgi:hypothetical protein
MMQRLFLAHPHKVGENYLEHMLFALTFSGRLFKAAGAALLHAFVPALCETTASQAIVDMHAEIVARRRTMAQASAAAVSVPAASLSYRGQGAANS